jgi:hypothetical protein
MHRAHTDFGDITVEEVFVDLPDVSRGTDVVFGRARASPPTILETFAPMNGNFRASPRSLAVIFRGNADDP